MTEWLLEKVTREPNLILFSVLITSREGCHGSLCTEKDWRSCPMPQKLGLPWGTRGNNRNSRGHGAAGVGVEREENVASPGQGRAEAPLRADSSFQNSAQPYQCFTNVTDFQEPLGIVLKCRFSPIRLGAFLTSSQGCWHCWSVLHTSSCKALIILFFCTSRKRSHVTDLLLGLAFIGCSHCSQPSLSWLYNFFLLIKRGTGGKRKVTFPRLQPQEGLRAPAKGPVGHQRLHTLQMPLLTLQRELGPQALRLQLADGSERKL